MMLTVGVDAHKQIHMAVAVDARGTVRGTWRGANTPAGWAELATWAAALVHNQAAFSGIARWASWAQP
jgi:hypothetical protein